MSIPTIKIGDDNWAVKPSLFLGYNDTNGIYIPREFTVSRGTTALEVDSAGILTTANNNIARIDYLNFAKGALFVEASAQNLALQSEDFTAAAWTVNGVTRTANQTTAPNGLTTADRISITSNSGYIRLILATSGSTTYTASCFVKNDTITGSDLFRFYFNNNRAAPNAAVAGASININAGTVTTTSTGGGVSDVSAGIENYGNGWYRVRVTFTLGAAAGGASTEIGFDATAATRTFFAWGAQLETGSVATTYIPTTTGIGSRAADTISLSNVSNLIGQTEGTIYAEVDVRNISGLKAIIQLDNGTGDNRLLIQLSSPNTLNFFAANGGTVFTIASGTITTGTHKIAASYSSANVQIYMDGLFLASGTMANYPSLALSNVSIGSRIFSGVQGNFLNDRIRAAALYTTRLSNNELQLLTKL